MRLALAVVLLVLPWSQARAEAQSDFTGLNVKPGDFVFVTDPAGVEVGGIVVSLSPSVLAIAGHSFKPEPGLKIERRGDPIWDGAATGALAGLGVGALLSGGECGVDWHAWQCALAGAAWGALFGTLIDFKHQGRTTVFVGTSPVRPTLPSHASIHSSLSVSVQFRF